MCVCKKDKDRREEEQEKEEPKGDDIVAPESYLEETVELLESLRVRSALVVWRRVAKRRAAFGLDVVDGVKLVEVKPVVRK